MPALAAPAVQATRRRGILSDRRGLNIFPLSGAVGPDGDIAPPVTSFENECESSSQQARPSQPSGGNGLEVLAKGVQGCLLISKSIGKFEKVLPLRT